METNANNVEANVENPLYTAMQNEIDVLRDEKSKLEKKVSQQEREEATGMQFLLEENN